MQPLQAQLLTECHVVDVRAGTVSEDTAILVTDGVIASVGNRDSVVREAEETADVVEVSLEGCSYVCPGLMNMHVHLGLGLPGEAGLRLRGETIPQLTMRAASNAMRALEAGVTTLRLVGERGHVDFAIRGAIEAGLAKGPRIFTAGHSVTSTGGHGSAGGRALEVDGPAEFRHAVRSQIKEGADLIKVMISGGISGAHEEMSTPQIADDELAAVIETAHMWGRFVTAHAGPADTIRVGLELGLDGIEHGYQLTEDVAETMVSQGTWLVPTIMTTRCEEFFARIGVPAYMTEKAMRGREQHSQSLTLAHGHGVKIALGTDMLPAEPIEGTNATVREAEHYVDHGMTPPEALRAATLSCAELLGQSERLGEIAPGRAADLIAMPENPLEDISALRGIAFVEKGGAVIRHDRAVGAAAHAHM